MRKIILISILAISLLLAACAPGEEMVAGEAIKLNSVKASCDKLEKDCSFETKDPAKYLASCSVVEMVLSASTTPTSSPLRLCTSAGKRCALGMTSGYSETPAGYFSNFVICNQQITAPETITSHPNASSGSPYVKISAVCC